MNSPTFDFDAASREESAERRRNTVMRKVEKRNRSIDPAWEANALAQLRLYARTHEHFAVEDFREAHPPPAHIDSKALGPLMQRAKREGIVEPDGYVKVRCSNLSPRVRWKSRVYEGQPESTPAVSSSAQHAQRR